MTDRDMNGGTATKLGPVHVVSWLEAGRASHCGAPVGSQVAALLAASARQLATCLDAAPDATGAAHDSSAALEDVVYARLLVRDMSSFSDVNRAYCDFFGSFPPSRSCVQCRLPQGTGDVSLSLHVHPGSGASVKWGDRAEREVLHVRSWSKWAPSCIGPYAQANRSRGAVHLAGQIGLVPETMTMVRGGARAELRLLM